MRIAIFAVPNFEVGIFKGVQLTYGNCECALHQEQRTAIIPNYTLYRSRQIRVVVVVVVITAPYPSLSLQNRAKENKLQPAFTRTVIVCKLSLSLSILWLGWNLFEKDRVTPEGWEARMGNWT